MPAFDFERLDVYKAAIEFIAVTHAIIERLPKGHAYLVDQLQRAATSIALNIAEGAVSSAARRRRGSTGWRGGLPLSAPPSSMSWRQSAWRTRRHCVAAVTSWSASA